jgi:hypothetical protein
LIAQLAGRSRHQPGIVRHHARLSARQVPRGVAADSVGIHLRSATLAMTLSDIAQHVSPISGARSLELS